jgi:DNA-binding IclR family transcriptional regulator
VYNDQAEVVAAVSITVPAQQLSDAQVAQLLPLVRAAAAQLTQRLSHLPTRGKQPAFAEPLTA